VTSAASGEEGGSQAERAVGLDEVVARLASGYRSVGEMVYEVIKEAIVSRTFAPGERLRQETLAEAIGVSRVPVRSALLRLNAEGLVSFNPRKGAVVSSLSVANVREIYKLRGLLEPYALRKSMATMTAGRVERLRELAAAVDQGREGRDFLDVRVAFYRELYDASGNPQLVELIEALRGNLGRYLLGWRVHSVTTDSHGDLIDHIARADVDKAERWLHSHLEDVGRGIERMLAEADPQATADKSRRRPPTAISSLPPPAHHHG
jgi:DNA-binding GntR family transcriptional regulator